ncbi:MAG TPA: carboxylating nicotinate-nucleotide diphosphorylase [Polyangiaceae bacterium]|nr:carboxylating nicotinate-nucleotide diphosphorylase [Polyangiaceae bacterium]
MISPLLDALIDRALAEDLGAGDVTSEAVVPSTTKAAARAVATQPLVLAGGDAFARVFYRVDAGARVERLIADGTRVEPGTALFAIDGTARGLLAAERTALNFIQRASGIATLTARFVAAVPAGSALRIVDTRKTTPGLRALEREAVRAGGGHNHRDNLGTAILIKDNHVAVAGGVRNAVLRAREHAVHMTRVEVEVDTLEQLDEALAVGAEVILLDNFTLDAVAEAVRRTARRALLEVSGGVRLENIAELARLGVDLVSIGALTHSAPAADISLEITPFGAGHG